MHPRGITNITERKQPQNSKESRTYTQGKGKETANTVIVRQSKSSKQNQKKKKKNLTNAEKHKSRRDNGR
jgi:hypothetical protein